MVAHIAGAVVVDVVRTDHILVLVLVLVLWG
jgi:hypothetical protein